MQEWHSRGIFVLLFVAALEAWAPHTPATTHPYMPCQERILPPPPPPTPRGGAPPPTPTSRSFNIGAW